MVQLQYNMPSPPALNKAKDVSFWLATLLSILLHSIGLPDHWCFTMTVFVFLPEQALAAVLSALRTLPKSQPLRFRLISFLHRMIGTLGRELLPMLLGPVEQLVQNSEVNLHHDLMKFYNKYGSLYLLCACYMRQSFMCCSSFKMEEVLWSP